MLDASLDVDIIKSYVKMHRKLFLPVAWLHRIFYRALSRESRIEFQKSVFTSEEKVQNRNKFLKKWGFKSFAEE